MEDRKAQASGRYRLTATNASQASMRAGLGRAVIKLFVGASCLVPVAVMAGDDKAVPLVFDVPPNGKIMLTIDGRAISAFAGPGMPSDLTLSRSYATAFVGDTAERPAEKPKKKFSIISIRRVSDAERGGPITTRIGPTVIAGRSRVVTSSSTSQSEKELTQWFETDAYSFGDALAGPYAIPSPVVRFRMLAPSANEVVSSVTLDREHNHWWLASTTKRIGNKNVLFAFAPHFRRTVASAAAGAVIAKDHSGRFVGRLESVLISHGVERPARAVTLAQPLWLGSVRIDDLLVRTRDYGSSASIANKVDVDPSESNEEIVVTGRRKASPAEYIVYVGTDALSGCSSIVYDKPAKLITLSCRRRLDELKASIR